MIEAAAFEAHPTSGRARGVSLKRAEVFRSVRNGFSTEVFLSVPFRYISDPFSIQSGTTCAPHLTNCAEMEPACAILTTALLVMSNDGLVQTLEEAFATDTLMQKGSRTPRLMRRQRLA